MINSTIDILLKIAHTLRHYSLTANVLGIGEEGAFENRQPILAQMYNRITNAQLLPSAPFLPIPC